MSIDLCDNYLNDEKKVPYGTLHAAFMTLDVEYFIPDNTLKLGFLMFIEGHFFGSNHPKYVNEDILSLSVNLQFFYPLAWGRISWAAAFSGLSVDLNK